MEGARVTLDTALKELRLTTTRRPQLPTGRRSPMEPKQNPSISLIEDKQSKKVSTPPVPGDPGQEGEALQRKNAVVLPHTTVRLRLQTRPWQVLASVSGQKPWGCP